MVIVVSVVCWIWGMSLVPQIFFTSLVLWVSIVMWFSPYIDEEGPSDTEESWASGPHAYRATVNTA